MASQVTVFVENRPGRISKIARILGESSINIRAITISDRGEYGLVNIITDDPDRAYKALTKEGLSVSRQQVIAIIIEDKPGALADVTEYLNKSSINVANAYGFILRSHEKAVLILEVDDFEKAERVIRSGGYHTLTKKELHNL